VPDAYDIRRIAEAVIGEDRVPTDVLQKLIADFGDHDHCVAAGLIDPPDLNLPIAREIGIEVEEARYDPYFLAQIIAEIVVLQGDERAAAVTAVNDGAKVSDRAAYASHWYEDCTQPAPCRLCTTDERFRPRA
jgi:hypothetical protein